MSSVQEDFSGFDLDKLSGSFIYLSNMQKMYFDLGCNVQKSEADVFSPRKHQLREEKPCTDALEADV